MDQSGRHQAERSNKWLITEDRDKYKTLTCTLLTSLSLTKTLCFIMSLLTRTSLFMKDDLLVWIEDRGVGDVVVSVEADQREGRCGLVVVVAWLTLSRLNLFNPIKESAGAPVKPQCGLLTNHKTSQSQSHFICFTWHFTELTDGQAGVIFSFLEKQEKLSVIIKMWKSDPRSICTSQRSVQNVVKSVMCLIS